MFGTPPYKVVYLNKKNWPVDSQAQNNCGSDQSMVRLLHGNSSSSQDPYDSLWGCFQPIPGKSKGKGKGQGGKDKDEDKDLDKDEDGD